MFLTIIKIHSIDSIVGRGARGKKRSFFFGAKYVSTTRRLMLMDHHRSQISNFQNIAQNLRMVVARTAINLIEL